MNPYRMTSYSALACLLLVTAVPSQAQQNSNQPQRSWEGLSSTSKRGQETSFRGTIESVRQADLVSRSQGYREQHYVVRLRMEDGRTQTVDLGPRKNLRDVNLQSGDQIRIQGRYVNIGGRRILMADQVFANGQTIRVARDQARSRNRTQQTVEGRVDGFRHLNLRSQGSQSQQHSLVKLRMQDGRSVVVDLGSKRDLDDLGLQRGDRIRIRGTRGTIDGRSALLANQIQVDGETIQVKRAPSASQGRTFTVSGRVNGYQVLSIGSGGKERVFLNLRLNDGRSVLIDSGEEYSRGELGLQELNIGDRVTIRGRNTTVQGRPVMLAENIQFTDPRQSGMGQGSQGQTGSGQRSSNQRDQNQDNLQMQRN